MSRETKIIGVLFLILVAFTAGVIVGMKLAENRVRIQN